MLLGPAGSRAHHYWVLVGARFIVNGPRYQQDPSLFGYAGKRDSKLMGRAGQQDVSMMGPAEVGPQHYQVLPPAKPITDGLYIYNSKLLSKKSKLMGSAGQLNPKLLGLAWQQDPTLLGIRTQSYLVLFGRRTHRYQAAEPTFLSSLPFSFSFCVFSLHLPLFLTFVNSIIKSQSNITKP